MRRFDTPPCFYKIKFFFFYPHTLTFRLKRPVYRAFSGEGRCEGVRADVRECEVFHSSTRISSTCLLVSCLLVSCLLVSCLLVYLKIKVNTELEADWTWIRIGIYTICNLRIDSLILGDDKWILHSEVYTAREIILSRILEECRE